MLLHWGADSNKEGKKEARPLLCAAMAGHDHVVRLLLRTSCEYGHAARVAAAVAAMLRSEGGDGGSGARPSPPPPLALTPSCFGEVEGFTPGTPSFSGAFTPGFGGGGGGVEARGSAEALFTALGLGPSPSGALKWALTKTGKGGEGDKKGTAASNAMGSTVAMQSGRGAGGATPASRAKLEDLPLDSCEPCVALALAALAAGTAGVDEFGLPAPARPPPYDATLYLPPEDVDGGGGGGASPSALFHGSTPPAADLVALFFAARGVAPPEKAGAPRKEKPLSFKQMALGKGLPPPPAEGGGGGGSPPAGEAPAGALGGGLTAADVASLPTFSSFLELGARNGELRSALRAAVAKLLARSAFFFFFFSLVSPAHCVPPPLLPRPPHPQLCAASRPQAVWSREWAPSPIAYRRWTWTLATSQATRRCLSRRARGVWRPWRC